MKINTNFMHPGQKFKLVYGSMNTIWENAQLSDGLSLEDVHDGLWLAKGVDGKWDLSTDSSLSFPILEMKKQYDNECVNSVTVARGSVPVVTSVYEFDGSAGYPSAPDIGMLLKTKDGVLVPVASDGSEDDLHVGIIEEIHGDRLVVLKRF